MGGNAQIRQQPVHPGNPLLGKNAFHILEVAGERLETGTEARQPEHGGAAGVRIAVNAPDGGALFQQKFRMAAAAKRAVHDEFAGARFQHVHRLMQQNGNVTEAVSGDGAVRFRVNSGNGVIPQFGNQGVHPGRGFPGFQGFRVVRVFPVHGGGQRLPGADQFIHSFFLRQLRNHMHMVAADAPRQHAAGRFFREPVCQGQRLLRADVRTRARA